MICKFLNNDKGGKDLYSCKHYLLKMYFGYFDAESHREAKYFIEAMQEELNELLYPNRLEIKEGPS